MITYDLSTVELCNMLEDSYYPDAQVTHSSKYSTLISKETMTYARVWTHHGNMTGITLPDYEALQAEAAPSGSTPVAIVGTPDGIFEFNLGVLKLEFELFSDGDKPDVMVAELAPAKGKRILEFYPDFDSQEEYIDSLMGDAEPSQWDESDTW